MIGSLDHPMFAFGVPPDTVALLALALALGGYFLPRFPWSRWRIAALVALGLSASWISWAYLQHYLGGLPRVIDATAYVLEARGLASGGLTFEVPEPTASFRGRFLVPVSGNDRALSVIFPPGYPALLALGVLLRHELFVGPMLAALLVAATYALTLAVTGRKKAALVAALLSTLNACLRYHTAETMSHGLSALLATVSVWASIKLRKPTRPDSLRWAVVLGGSLGLLIATRQLTGVLVACACCVSIAAQIFARTPPPVWRKRGPLLGFSLALIPGLVLLLAHHYVVTGSVFSSPQSAYYDLADGPGACFGWGLGRGCGYEHADVVAQQGGRGLPLAWAFLNTVHRLHWHLQDIANFEPLALFAFFMAWKFRKRPAFLPLLLCLGAIPMGYAFFYFNGSYPGAGARFFSELIPLWHAILGAGLSLYRVERVALVAPLFGFAVHGAYIHRALRQPHFGPDLSGLHALRGDPRMTRHRGESPPLVFFSSAHGFNLAALSSPHFTAARRTFDSREHLLEHSGTNRTAWEFLPGPQLDLRRLAPLESFSGRVLDFESESDFPPLSVEGVWVHPDHLALACVSRGRVLSVHRELDPSSAASLTLEVPAPRPGPYRVALHWVNRGRECVRTDLGGHEAPKHLVLDLRRFPTLTHIDRLELTKGEASAQHLAPRE